MLPVSVVAKPSSRKRRASSSLPAAICSEVTEDVAGKFPEASVTREGFVGDASVDEIGRHAAGAGLGEVLRPELAFDQDDDVRADAAPGEGAAGPEVGREDADRVGHVGVSFLRQPEARARGGGQDDLRLARGLQLAEQGADGLDFPDGDGLEPETAFSGGLRAGGGEEAEPLAETRAIAPATEHPPEIVGEGRDQQQREEYPVGPRHRVAPNLPRRAPGVSSKGAPFG
jgi:hypothetical protein